MIRKAYAGKDGRRLVNANKAVPAANEKEEKRECKNVNWEKAARKFQLSGLVA
jgi:hypothetical protein